MIASYTIYNTSGIVNTSLRIDCADAIYNRTPIIRTTWDRTRFGYAEILIIRYTVHVSQNYTMHVKNTPIMYKDMIFNDTLYSIVYVQYTCK